MEQLLDSIQVALMPLLGTIITGVITFVGVKVNEYLKTKLNTQTKKDVAKSTVKYIEQVYKDIHGQEKFEKAKDKLIEQLNLQGIKITEEEIDFLIEAAVNGFNASKGN